MAWWSRSRSCCRVGILLSLFHLLLFVSLPSSVSVSFAREETAEDERILSDLDQECTSANDQVLIVCDLAHGVPAFLELESLWLYLAFNLASEGRNVTLLPIADAKVDFAQDYFSILRDKVDLMLRESESEEKDSAGEEGAAIRSKLLVRLAHVPVYHHYSTPSRSIQRSYAFYTFLKEHEETFKAVYYTDWGGAAYYSLLAKEQKLFFKEMDFVQVQTVGTRLDNARQRGVVSTTELLTSLDEVQAAYMELESQSEQKYTSILRPSDLKLTSVQSHVFGGRRSTTSSPSSKQDLELAFVGTISQADGVDLFMRAVEKLCRSIYSGDEGEKPFDESIHVSFLGHPTYLHPKIALQAKRKKLGQLQVQNFFNGWIKRMGTEFEGKVKISVLSIGLEEQLDYFKHKQNAVGVLCSDNLKQRFVESVLKANRVKLILPNGNLEGGTCSFKATSSGLYRTLAHILHNPNALNECERHNLTLANNDVLDAIVSDPSVLKTQVNQSKLGGNKQGKEMKENATLVSCIITHYNRGRYLLQALASMLEQTHENIEIIVVDDGSTDQKSLDILAEIEQKHAEKCIGTQTKCVKVLRIENTYLGTARNVGLKASRGEFVLFMDDDNYAKPHEVSTFLQVMHETGCDIAACASEYLPSSLDPKEAFNSTLYRQETRKVHIPLGPSVSSGLFTNTFGDANLMVRRSTCSNFSWPEDDAYSVQDWEVLARESTRSFHKIHLIPEPLFFYRTTSTSMAQSASISSISQHSEKLYLRSFLNELPLGLGPLIPYIIDLREESRQAQNEVQELEKRNKMLTTALRPLVLEHCKFQKMHNADPFSKNVIKNPSFSEWNQLEMYKRSGQLAKEWDRYESGYTFSREGMKGANLDSSAACLVKLDNIGKVAGAMQEAIINQKEPKPLLLHGWSKALNVSGAGQSADYSLYADTTFMDGTHSWAFTIPFDQNKEGWQEAFGILDFPKPIHSILVVLMFRWRTGAVAFDNITLTNLEAGICGVKF